MSKPLCLVGMIGSGKTHLALQLGKHLHWPVIDTDAWIEHQTGSTIANFVLNHGWDKFRELEALFCEEFVYKQPCIISTGGGFPMQETTFQWLVGSCHTIYLRVRPELALERVLKDEQQTPGKRPMMKNKTETELSQFFQKLYLERKETYEQFPFSVDANRSLDEVFRNLIEIAAIAQIK